MAPFSLAEEWDNVGLQVGDPSAPVERIMVALDGGPAAIRTAIDQNCQLLLTHHPFIFSPIKKITPADTTGKLITQALRNNLAVISLHTNLDIAAGGVNDLLADRLGVTDCVPLKITGTDDLVKLAVFVPRTHEEQVLEALFRHSGEIGNYRDCSFRVVGTGTFRPLDGANPHIGKVGTRESVEESRVEVLLRRADISSAVNALIKAHPYEEPAFDLYPILNKGPTFGLGRIGTLLEGVALSSFASFVKERLGCDGLRYVGEPEQLVRKIALCGGSGASLIREAVRQGADVLVTGDIKYHEARDAESTGLALVDAGHFATEVLMVNGVAEKVRTILRKRNYDVEVIEYEGEREPFQYL